MRFNVITLGPSGLQLSTCDCPEKMQTVGTPRSAAICVVLVSLPKKRSKPAIMGERSAMPIVPARFRQSDFGRISAISLAAAQSIPAPINTNLKPPFSWSRRVSSQNRSLPQDLIGFPVPGAIPITFPAVNERIGLRPLKRILAARPLDSAKVATTAAANAMARAPIWATISVSGTSGKATSSLTPEAT